MWAFGFSKLKDVEVREQNLAKISNKIPDFIQIVVTVQIYEI
jgi:hypothetical protein